MSCTPLRRRVPKGGGLPSLSLSRTRPGGKPPALRLSPLPERAGPPCARTRQRHVGCAQPARAVMSKLRDPAMRREASSCRAADSRA